MKILVTGASGYIGAHVCKKLAEHGHRLDILDNHHHIEYNDVAQYAENSYIRDVRNMFECSYDCVIHLAGRTVVPESMQHPYEYYDVNINGTQRVLEYIKTDHVIFASTSSAWEMASPYAKSKVAAEDIIKASGVPYTIFRFFNVSGSNGTHRQLGSSTHLIRVAAEVACGKRSHIDIYGTDYPTADGTCVRDYVHVEDLANSILKSVTHGALNSPYECIGSNKGYSVLDVVAAMENATGKILKKNIVGRRPGDAAVSVVDKLSKFVILEKSIEDMCLSQYVLELSKRTT